MKKLLIEKLFLFRIPDKEKDVRYLPLLMTSHLDEMAWGQYRRVRELVPLFNEKGKRLPGKREDIQEKMKEHILKLSLNNEIHHSILIAPEEVQKKIKRRPEKFLITDTESFAEKLFELAEEECEDLEEYIRRNLRLVLIKRGSDLSVPILENVTSDTLCDIYDTMEESSSSYHFAERMDFLGKYPRREIFTERGRGTVNERILVKKEKYYVIDVTPEETFAMKKRYLIGRFDLITSKPQRALKFPNAESAMEYAFSHMQNIKASVFDVMEMEEEALLSMKKHQPDQVFWT